MIETFSISYYQMLVFMHILLFVLWLGADVGVFMLGQHFRKRETYDLPQRLVRRTLRFAVLSNSKEWGPEIISCFYLSLITFNLLLGTDR